MVWRVGETVKFWANQPVGVPSCPFPPRPAAPPCAAAPSSARGMSGFLIRKVFEERIPLLRRNPFISELRNRRSKKSPSTIFRTRNLHLQSSIFGLEERRTPIFNLRSTVPNRRTRPPSIFGTEERVEDRTEDGGCDFFEDGGILRRWEDSSIFRLRRTKNPSSSTFLVRRKDNLPLSFHLLGWKNEDPPSSSSSSNTSPTNPRRVS